MTLQDEIVTELLSTGLTPHQLALLVRLVSVMSSGLSTGSRVESPVDAVERRREWDRNYKRKRRAEARTAESGQSAGQADAAHNLSFLLSSKESEESKRTSKEVSKKDQLSVVREKPQRGVRLSPDAKLTLSDLDFALSLGMTEENARKLWAEFVDYWTGVPGQRGCKTAGERGWPGTWRNRVRFITGNDGKTGASNAKTSGIVGAQQKLIGKLAELNRPAPAIGASAICGGEGGGSVRLIPKG